MFNIESGVPVPPKGVFGRSSKYPWQLMDVDDSFMVEKGNLKSLRTTAYGAGKRMGLKFTARAVEGGVRVWRVA